MKKFILYILLFIISIVSYGQDGGQGISNFTATAGTAPSWTPSSTEASQFAYNYGQEELWQYSSGAWGRINMSKRVIADSYINTDISSTVLVNHWKIYDQVFFYVKTSSAAISTSQILLPAASLTYNGKQITVISVDSSGTYGTEFSAAGVEIYKKGVAQANPLNLSNHTTTTLVCVKTDAGTYFWNLIDNDVLSSITTDGTLTGAGTTGSPLKVDTSDIATQYDLTSGLSSYLPLAGGTMIGDILMTSNKIIGGSTTTSDLFLQTTSGVGATGADMHFLVGNNGATEAMTILNSGLVGIGTTGPANTLTVTKGAGSGFNLQYNATGAARTGLFMSTIGSSVAEFAGGAERTSDTEWTARSTVASIMQMSDGKVTLFNNSGLTSGNTFTPTASVTILSTGNVGIGTSVPDRLGHFESTTALTSTTNYQLRLSHITSGTAAAGFGAGMEYELEDGSNVNVVAGTEAVTWQTATTGATSANYSLGLMRAGTPTNVLAVLGATGFVGIGTVSPGANLHVKKGASGGVAPHANTILALEGGGTSYLELIHPNTASAYILFSNNIFAAGHIQYDHTIDLMGFSTNVGDNEMVITSAGNVGIGNTNPLELLTLGLAGTTKGVLSLSGNTSGKIIIQPAAAAGTWTWTLPADDGTANQVLQTDGAGITSWTTPTAADGNGIYSGSGTIPAGTNNATLTAAATLNLRYSSTQDAIHIVDAGTIRLSLHAQDALSKLEFPNASSLVVTNSAATQSIMTLQLRADQTGTPQPGDNALLGFFLKNSVGTRREYVRFKAEIVDTTNASEDGKLSFLTYTAGSLTEKVVITEEGRMGIGTSIPSFILSLGGDGAQTFWMEPPTGGTGAGNIFNIRGASARTGTTDTNGGALYLRSGVSNGSGSSEIIFQTSPAGATGTTARANTTKMTINGAGEVGIFTAPVTNTRLTVAGNLIGINSTVTGTSAAIIGLRGEATGNTGGFASAGVYGRSAGATGFNYGGHFQVDSTATINVKLKVGDGSAASGKWAIQSGEIWASYLRGAISVGETPSNTARIYVGDNALGVTQSEDSGIALVNTTAAAAGAQQISPAIRWTGQGWKTTATAASQAVSFLADILPVEGTANPSATWQLKASINGGAYSNKLSVTSAGNVITEGTFRLKGYTVSGLPAGVIGDMAYVTDATTPTYGATAVGGGAVVTPVFYNGTNWTTR